MTNVVYPITFLLRETPSQEEIVGAFISIWDETFNNLIVPNLTTNVDGTATVGLPDGVYNAVFYNEGFTFTPIFFHVTGAPITFVVEGDVSVISPTVRGYCLFFGWVKDVSNKPIVDTTVRVRVFPVPQYKDSNVLSKQDYVLYTDANGYFEQSLIGGVKVTVTVPEANYQTIGVLPITGKIDITQLDKQWSS